LLPLSCEFKTKETDMKLVLTTIAVSSTLTLVGCNKTKKITAAQTAPPITEVDVDVDVEVDDNKIVLTVSGEERKGYSNGS
jgi:hypothetical protein